MQKIIDLAKKVKKKHDNTILWMLNPLLKLLLEKKISEKVDKDHQKKVINPFIEEQSNIYKIYETHGNDYKKILTILRIRLEKHRRQIAFHNENQEIRLKSKMKMPYFDYEIELKEWIIHFLKNEISRFEVWIKRAPEAKEIKGILWTGTKEQLAAAINTFEELNCIKAGQGFKQWQDFAEHFDYWNQRKEVREKITADQLNDASSGDIGKRKKVIEMKSTLTATLKKQT